MRPRHLALLLLAAAALLYAAVALPARSRAATAGEEYRRLRTARREAQSRLAGLQRREAERGRAGALLAAASLGPGEAHTRLRRAIVDSLREVPVSGARLVVQPGVAPVAATVRLSAQGSYPDVLRLAGRLAGPRCGVVLERVRLSPAASGGLLIELEGMSPGVSR